eukprot:7382042-Prymnesium_polylepis.1
MSSGRTSSVVPRRAEERSYRERDDEPAAKCPIGLKNVQRERDDERDDVACVDTRGSGCACG